MGVGVGVGVCIVFCSTAEPVDEPAHATGFLSSSVEPDGTQECAHTLNTLDTCACTCTCAASAPSFAPPAAHTFCQHVPSTGLARVTQTKQMRDEYQQLKNSAKRAGSDLQEAVVQSRQYKKVREGEWMLWRSGNGGLPDWWPVADVRQADFLKNLRCRGGFVEGPEYAVTGLGALLVLDSVSPAAGASVAVGSFHRSPFHMLSQQFALLPALFSRTFGFAGTRESQFISIS